MLRHMFVAAGGADFLKSRLCGASVAARLTGSMIAWTGPSVAAMMHQVPAAAQRESAA